MRPKPSAVSTSRRHELAFIYKWNTFRHKRPYDGVQINGLSELLWIASTHGWVLQTSLSWQSRIKKNLSNIQAEVSKNPDTSGIVDLRGAILLNVDLSKLDFSGARLELCQFKACTLKDTVFVGADLRGVRFINTPLNSARFLDENEQNAIESLIPDRDISAYAIASHDITLDAAPGGRIKIKTRNELLWFIQNNIDARFLDLRAADIYEDDIHSLAIPSDAMQPERWQEMLAQIERNGKLERPSLAQVKISCWQDWYWLRATATVAADYTLNEPPQYDMREADLRGARFAGAHLQAVNLSHAHLDNALLDCSDLRHANLERAHLELAQLTYAKLDQATLRRAVLRFANLEGASLFETNLRRARMEGARLLGARASVANLRGARCRNADFSCVDLRGARVNASTSLIDITINSATLWGDIVWRGIPLLDIDWSRIKRLGDEMLLDMQAENFSVESEGKAQEEKTRDILYREVTRAYHQLYIKLKDQGFYAVSTHLRLREKALERQQLWEHHQFTKWAQSFISFALIGYGEKPGRLIVVYAGVVEIWAAIYLLIERQSLPAGQQGLITSAQAVLLSLSALKGTPSFPKEILRQHIYGALISGAGALETGIGSIILLAFTILWTQRLLGNELPHLRPRRGIRSAQVSYGPKQEQIDGPKR